MLAVNDLWNLIEPVVQAEGLQLYDIEFGGSGTGGVLRVTLWRSGSQNGSGSSSSVSESSENGSGRVESGVSIDDCAVVSRKISAIDRFEDILPAKTTLEVSSPGINRKLRRKKHFGWASGERVKLRVLLDDGEDSLVGILHSMNDDGVLRFQPEPQGSKEMEIRLEDVVKAKVDFKFE